MPSEHYERVKDFMQKVGQETPSEITVPNEKTRHLRAKLILEEAMETIHALGFSLYAHDHSVHDSDVNLIADRDVDLIEIADGCADVSVVTIGTLIAFGIDDEPLLREVDASNLRKFGPGSHRREDGKWMKPKGWTPPNIKEAIGA